jgi:hypothetical protein
MRQIIAFIRRGSETKIQKRVKISVLPPIKNNHLFSQKPHNNIASEVCFKQQHSVHNDLPNNLHYRYSNLRPCALETDEPTIEPTIFYYGDGRADHCDTPQMQF